MKKLLSLLAVIMVFLAACSQVGYEPVTLQQVPYSLDETVFRVTTKDGKTHIMRKLRISITRNLMKGLDLESEETKTISLSELKLIEKRMD